MKKTIFDKVLSYDSIFTKLPENVPTRGVPDGPMFGNGDLGIVAGGTTENLTMWIAKNDFWSSSLSHNEEVLGGVKGLAALKINSRKFRKAQFRAKQRIATADVVIELETEKELLRVTSYAPYQQSLILMELEAVKGDIPLRVFLDPLSDEFAEYSRKTEKNMISVKKAYCYNVEWETRAALCGRIMEWESTENVLQEGEKVLVAVSAYTNHDTDAYEIRALEAVNQLTKECLAQYRQKHLEWWKAFWNRSGVELPTEPEVEKFWYGSHYLMACCSKGNCFAPGIFGNWITTNEPNWAGDYHLNYNYQAPWWGVYSSNKVELAEPYDRPLLEYVPQAKKNARERLGCNGVYYKVGIGPKGYETSRMFKRNGMEDTEAPYWGQKSNASYAAVNMLMRFYSTWDLEYAKQCVLPYLQEVAAFWEDYLVFENGRYMIYDDCIHENVVSGRDVFDWAASGEQDYSHDVNPILSLALVRMVFQGILVVSEYLGVNRDKKEKWSHILENMSPYPVQIREGREVFRYTEKGMDWNDGNSLGIQHIYPVGAIGLSSDEKLLRIARDTIEVMGRWADYNAFPTFFTAAARVGYDPEIILVKFKEQFLNHSFANYFIYYGGGGIECCSTVPGCINEMLFQSHEGILRFFPVWERNKNAAFEKLRGYGAFVVSASLRDGVIGDIEIYSEQGRDCSVLCPWESGMVVTEEDAPVDCESKVTRDGIVYCFATRTGKTYQLAAK